MNEWEGWIGREDVRDGHVEPAAVTRWLAALDRAPCGDGSVPQAYHWCLCLPDAPTASLGVDGHPLREESANSFLPPVPLPRRMWAASKLEFVAPLRPGESVIRRSHIASVTEKQGGTGKLVFAEIWHEIHGDGALRIRERQSIVFREAAPGNAAPVPAPLGDGLFDRTVWDTHLALIPTETLLFRYSALTFNSHRIHYDLPYATGVEGYRGLVVQGPLTATLLLDFAARELGDNRIIAFDFKGMSPAICGDELHLVMRGTGGVLELGAFAGDGRHVMAASATL